MNLLTFREKCSLLNSISVYLIIQREEEESTADCVDGNNYVCNRQLTFYGPGSRQHRLIMEPFGFFLIIKPDECLMFPDRVKPEVNDGTAMRAGVRHSPFSYC